LGHTFRSPEGLRVPLNSINTHFLAVLDHFLYKNGPMDLVKDPF
jgi:hypothetical protein